MFKKNKNNNRNKGVAPFARVTIPFDNPLFFSLLFISYQQFFITIKKNFYYNTKFFIFSYQLFILYSKLIIFYYQ
jgi:hypothetical protein